MTKHSDLQQGAAIVRRIQTGDEQAQGELIDLVQIRLFRFCLLLSHNREFAEDLCQDTLIKALQNIQTLKNPETFLGWMYQIAKNLFIDLNRKRGNQNQFADEVMSPGGNDPNFELILSIQRLLSQFEPEDRFLLLLVELDGHSYKEAADVIGTSEDAVRSKLHRLRGLFIKKYGSDEAG